MKDFNFNIGLNISTAPLTEVPPVIQSDDYAELLQHYGLDYKLNDYYLVVGELTQVQGWILHISVVVSQITAMLQKVVPVLVEENISFKIAMDRETCANLLNGALGVPQLGKLVCIYPNNDIQALNLAKKLIQITSNFKGPDIPTDIALGKILFTRYGSWNPIIKNDENGKENKYIYNINGELIKDPYAIPFQLPDGINWPFSELASPIVPIPKKVLNYSTKPTLLLKSDVRGNVYKGIYVKGLFRTTACVIKEGKKNMISEDNGRDIRDRLLWQHDLHKKLSEVLPIPKILDLFVEEGNTYLVMEYIKGIPFEDRLKHFTVNRMNWQQLPSNECSILLNYLLELLSIIESLHRNGYVHRDIQQSNFIIDKYDRICMIDMELAWSLSEGIPNPTFHLGTPGFMSPEQQAISTPTVKEDIYGIGALLLSVLTGLSPTKFNTKIWQQLTKNIQFFIGHNQISNMITECLHSDPQVRPCLPTIKSKIEQYKKELSSSHIRTLHKSLFEETSPDTIQKIITASINGLVNPPTIFSEGIWYSKRITTENPGGNEQKEYTRQVGLQEGIGGVLYMLGRAKRLGIDIDSCKDSYYIGWEYIEEKIITSEVPLGLYNGKAGIALALADGIRSGLLDDNEYNRQSIQRFLIDQSIGLDLVNGITGQAVVALNCKDYLNLGDTSSWLHQYVAFLLQIQQKDGSWILQNNTKEKEKRKPIGFGKGISGIIWFLLQYMSIHEDSRVEKATLESLAWLNKKTNYLKDLFNRNTSKKIIGNELKTGDEWVPVIMTYIKAYELFGDNIYRQIVEDTLFRYPALVVTNNFTQTNGLAGLGEVYLEAWRILKNEEWKQRANWITNVFVHTASLQENGTCFWQLEEASPPTADLMVGTSGIIHFLLRSMEPDKLGYRMLT